MTNEEKRLAYLDRKQDREGLLNAAETEEQYYLAKRLRK